MTEPEASSPLVEIQSTSQGFQVHIAEGDRVIEIVGEPLSGLEDAFREAVNVSLTRSIPVNVFVRYGPYATEEVATEPEPGICP